MSVNHFNYLFVAVQSAEDVLPLLSDPLVILREVHMESLFIPLQESFVEGCNSLHLLARHAQTIINGSRGANEGAQHCPL